MARKVPQGLATVHPGPHPPHWRAGVSGRPLGAQLTESSAERPVREVPGPPPGDPDALLTSGAKKGPWVVQKEDVTVLEASAQRSRALQFLNHLAPQNRNSTCTPIGSPGHHRAGVRPSLPRQLKAGPRESQQLHKTPSPPPPVNTWATQVPRTQKKKPTVWWQVHVRPVPALGCRPALAEPGKGAQPGPELGTPWKEELECLGVPPSVQVPAPKA